MKAPALFLSTLTVVVAGCTFPVEKKTVVENPPPVVHEQKEVIVEHPVPPLPSCSYGGIDYADGSFSCQGGLEYRCDDGTWVSRVRAC
jgi:hypothetical protein